MTLDAAFEFAGRMSNTDRYSKLVDAYKKANPTKSKQIQLQDAQSLWRKVKKESDAYDRALCDLREKWLKREAKQMSFWAQIPKKKVTLKKKKKRTKIKVFYCVTNLCFHFY